MKDELEFFDKWLNTQKDFLDNWIETSKKFQSSFWLGEISADNREEVFSLYSSWTKTIGKTFDEYLTNYPFEKRKDIFEKMKTSIDSFSGIFDFHTPILNELLKKSVNIDNVMAALDSSAYKESIDRIFGFVTTETVSDFYKQTLEIVDIWVSTQESFLKPWTDAIRKNTETIPYLLSGNPMAGMEIFKNLYDAFENSLTSRFKIQHENEEREKLELIKNILDRHSSFIAQNVEFQKKIYITAQEIIESVIRQLVQEISDGNEIKSSDKILKMWMDRCIKEYNTLFSSKDFSKLQSQLLKAALNARKYFQVFMEKFIEDFHGANNTITDTIYETIREMNKNIVDLETRFSEIIKSQ